MFSCSSIINCQATQGERDKCYAWVECQVGNSIQRVTNATSFTPPAKSHQFRLSMATSYIKKLHAELEDKLKNIVARENALLTSLTTSKTTFDNQIDNVHLAQAKNIRSDIVQGLTTT
jgi:uncharacterized protein (DUF342 family)